MCMFVTEQIEQMAINLLNSMCAKQEKITSLDFKLQLREQVPDNIFQHQVSAFLRNAFWTGGFPEHYHARVVRTPAELGPDVIHLEYFPCQSIADENQKTSA